MGSTYGVSKVELWGDFRFAVAIYRFLLCVENKSGSIDDL